MAAALDDVAQKHAEAMAELISAYAAPLRRRAAQAPHGRGRRSRLRRSTDACRFFDDVRASRLDDPRAEKCVQDARDALKALRGAVCAENCAWDALGRHVLRAAAQDLDALDAACWRAIAEAAIRVVVGEVAQTAPAPPPAPKLPPPVARVEPPAPKLLGTAPRPLPPPEPIDAYAWEDTPTSVTVTAELPNASRLASAEFSETSVHIIVKDALRELRVPKLWARIDTAASRAAVETGKLVVTLRKKARGAWPRLVAGGDTAAPDDPQLARAVEADARSLPRRRHLNAALGPGACEAATAVRGLLRSRAPFATIEKALGHAPAGTCECRLQSHSTLLHTACDERRSDVVRILLAESDVDARSARLFTPLHLAAGSLASLANPSAANVQEAAACVTLLLERGADPSLLDDAGRAPLHLACLQTGTFGIVEALVRGGADPAQPTTDGYLAVDAAHTVGALTEDLRSLLARDRAVAPAGYDLDDAEPLDVD